MTKDEALKLALEALELTSRDYREQRHAITAIREALAQPEQEPVAWGVFDGLNLHDMFFTEAEAQELARLKGDGSNVKPLYTTPPHRKPWVGLTWDDLPETAVGDVGFMQGAKWAEAKLKEKNHG